MRSFLKRLALVLASTLLALSLCEGAIQVMLSRPALLRHLPDRLQGGFRRIYMDYDRAIVQFVPACARYDAELLYTLRPGRCVFSAREFSNELRINRLGVRDDEQALVAPEIVVVGDSYAMGWGVDEEVRFAALLKRQTGYRVLDAAVPSWGTAREFKFLDRVDLSQVKFIVIQYDENDDPENIDFLDNHNALRTHSESDYLAVVKDEAQRRRYYWGKYFFALLRRHFSGRAEAAEADEARAPEAFLNAIAHAGRQSLDSVQLLAFSSHGDQEFFPKMDALRHDPRYPRFIREMKLLDLTPLLTADCYYLLDDHFNARGHSVVANELLQRIGRKGTP
jgi:hypothetical protein